MTPLEWTGTPRLRTAIAPHARWLTAVQLWRPEGADELITGDVETAVVLLSGTFDLSAGATAWPARGSRSTPLQGRPMAVFLPKQTTFRAHNGSGEILLVAARQPAAPAVTGREALSQKPLLPMAGSGKAFDPATGEWLPAEAFPSAAESLPPRRFERFTVGACTVERVFAPSYKAATLSLDEVIVPAGQTLRVAEIPGRPRCDEVCVFVRDDRGDRVSVTSGTGDDAAVTAPANAPAYVVLAYAGKPASGS